MKQIKSIIAVLATAALILVAFNSKAADSYSPTSTSGREGVSVSSTYKGLQVSPASYVRLLGYTGASSNSSTLTSTGTNFVAIPKAPVQYITCSSNVNFVSTNPAASSTTAWQTTIVIDPNGADRTLSIPSWWKTNSATRHFYFTTVSNGWYQVFNLTGFGTNVYLTVDHINQ